MKKMKQTESDPIPKDSSGEPSSSATRQNKFKQTKSRQKSVPDNKDLHIWP